MVSVVSGDCCDCGYSDTFSAVEKVKNFCMWSDYGMECCSI